MPDVAASVPRESWRFFISAVSGEFADERRELDELLERYGSVQVQREYPTNLRSGNAIADAIERADFIVCLIGHRSGMKMPRQDRPPNAWDGCSWTQWEYVHARGMLEQDPGKYMAVFIDKSAPPEPPDAAQEAYRDRIYRQDERDSYRGIFFYPYQGKEALLDSIDKMIRDPHSVLQPMLDQYWVKVTDAYRRAGIDAWRDMFPDTYRPSTDAATRARVMRAPKPPYIETRQFLVLAPQNGEQLRFLHPRGFLTGRDTNAVLDARQGADWRPIAPPDATPGPGSPSDGERIVDLLCQPEGEDMALGTVKVDSPLRLFVVSGSGIGKSASLGWFESKINQRGLQGRDTRLALLLQAGKLRDLQDRETLLDYLVEHLLGGARASLEEWSRNAARASLLRAIDSGRLILIIDGLDHVGIDPPLLIESQNTGAFDRCPVVMAGRPQTLYKWQEQPGPERAAHVIAARWRFIQPMEFTEDEAEVFLGADQDINRASAVGEHLGRLMQVPRVLEYVRKLGADRLRHVRTMADIYFSAVWGLVAAAMQRPAARRVGPDPTVNTDEETVSAARVEYMIALLAALGFESLCTTVDPREPHASFDFQMDLSDADQDRLRTRLNHATRASRTAIQLKDDLLGVVEMSSVIDNGLLENLAPLSTPTLTRIVWANRTIQQFFAALWLTRYADGVGEVARLMDGGALRPSEDPAFDAQRARNYIYYPEADIQSVRRQLRLPRTDASYEFDLFIAEMPRDPRAIDPARWVAAASAWYDPRLFRGAARSQRIWASEMLYRSWPTMVYYAARSLDDWWNASYANLAAHRPGEPREDISPNRPPARFRPSDPACALARRVLDRFHGDFANVLSGRHGAETQAAARQMINPDHWIAVPEETAFMMGTPDGLPQGCPTRKVDNYWQEVLLDPVQLQLATPADTAEKGTLKEWFATGSVGDKGRAGDVEWLRGLLQPLWDECGDTPPAKPDRDSPAYRAALVAISKRFKTQDETPQQNPQYVAGFEMHRFPVLHRWFWLFAPGHRLVVADYLAGLTYLMDPSTEPYRRLDAPPAHPPGDHPVIYITWFDAWAFCQWATWLDNGTRYSLRLPHEPEWESAAHWHTDSNGHPARSDRAWRWWWGDTFYADVDSLEPETPDELKAHVDGRPGKTRAPAEAMPNGLGFADILGNVWEWTASLYNEKRERDLAGEANPSLGYSRDRPADPPQVNDQRTMRGGLWYYLNILSTCANRFRYVCNDRDYRIGFRVVREGAVRVEGAAGRRRSSS